MSKIRHVPIAPTETRRLTSGEDVDAHRHDDHQLIYSSSGVLEVMVESGTWFTPSNRAVWVPGGTEHRWRVHGATRVHLVGVPARRKRPWGHEPAPVLVDPLFRELLIACSETGPAVSPEQRRMLAVLIDRIRPAPEPATMVPVLRDARLREVQAVLEADMTSSPTLGELGRRIGVGERTLSRLFHDTVGMGFTVWRTQLRLHRAGLLLAQDRTVTQAAAACGFSSPSAFIVAFQAAFGRTPGSLYR